MLGFRYPHPTRVFFSMFAMTLNSSVQSSSFAAYVFKKGLLKNTENLEYTRSNVPNLIETLLSTAPHL